MTDHSAKRQSRRGLRGPFLLSAGPPAALLVELSSENVSLPSPGLWLPVRPFLPWGPQQTPRPGSRTGTTPTPPRWLDHSGVSTRRLRGKPTPSVTDKGTLAGLHRGFLSSEVLSANPVSAFLFGEETNHAAWLAGVWDGATPPGPASPPQCHGGDPGAPAPPLLLLSHTSSKGGQGQLPPPHLAPCAQVGSRLHLGAR